MSLSRANFETVLVKRAGPLMTKAGMAVTVVGSNADLNDPIGYALRQKGYTTADVTSVTTAEVSSVATEHFDEVFDIAEYRLLENILGSLDDVDTRLGPRSEMLSQLAKQVEAKLSRLSRRMQTLYGYGAPALEVGVITNRFAQGEDLTVEEDE